MRPRIRGKPKKYVYRPPEKSVYSSSLHSAKTIFYQRKTPVTPQKNLFILSLKYGHFVLKFKNAFRDKTTRINIYIH